LPEHIDKIFAALVSLEDVLVRHGNRAINLDIRPENHDPQEPLE
jgi:hypothetical protein